MRVVVKRARVAREVEFGLIEGREREVNSYNHCLLLRENQIYIEKSHCFKTKNIKLIKQNLAQTSGPSRF